MKGDLAFIMQWHYYITRIAVMPLTVCFKIHRGRSQLRGPEFDSLSLHTIFTKNKLRLRQNPFLCVCCSFIPYLAYPKRRKYLYCFYQKCSAVVSPRYLFVTSAIMSALIMTSIILCEVMQLYSGTNVRTFRRNVLPLTSGQKC